MRRAGMLGRKGGGWGKRKVKITRSGALVRKRHPSKENRKRRM